VLAVAAISSTSGLDGVGVDVHRVLARGQQFADLA
jgi:hypothetical protein